jgi:predicted O-methyltransferase YrrM
LTSRPTERWLRPRWARYLASLRPPLDPAARRVESAAAAAGGAISSPEEARLLEALAARTPRGRVLELGTGGGYGTLHLARGAREGRVVSIDRDAGALATARAALDAAGVGERVELVESEALEFLARASECFDLVVADVDPATIRRVVDLSLPLLEVGGGLAVLRLFAAGAPGEASRESSPEDWQRERMHPYLLVHPQLASVLLPIGGGVGYAVKRRVTVRELGGPY